MEKSSIALDSDTRTSLALAFSDLRSRRMEAGDLSCSIEALARRADLTPTVVRRMLSGEVLLGLCDLFGFGSLGLEMLEWAADVLRARLSGGAR